MIDELSIGKGLTQLEGGQQGYVDAKGVALGGYVRLAPKVRTCQQLPLGSPPPRSGLCVARLNP